MTGILNVDQVNADQFRSKDGTINPFRYFDKANWPTIANDGVDADHDIVFSAGGIYSLAGDLIVLPADMTKQIDAAWAAGDAAGGLFSGTVAADTTYHCFLIVKDSDGSVDAGFDTSPTAANIPTGYTAYRRVHSVVTNASSNIISFLQLGDTIQLRTTNITLADSSPPTTGTVVALGALPTGLNNAIAQLGVNIYDPNNTIRVYIKPVGFTTGTPTVNTQDAQTVATTGEAASVQLLVAINSNAEVIYAASFATLNSFNIRVQGWIDPRID